MEHAEDDEEEDDEDEEMSDVTDDDGVMVDVDDDVESVASSDMQESSPAASAVTDNSSSKASTASSVSDSHSLRANKPDTIMPDHEAEEAAEEEEDPLDIPPNATILANKRAHPTLSRLFRSKGEFYLATRPHRAGDWSQAGAMLTLTGGRAWFCTGGPDAVSGKRSQSGGPCCRDRTAQAVS
mgnify:CR=1 FL=1